MFHRYILPALTSVLAVALIGLTVYAVTSISSLRTDVANAKTQLAAAKSDMGERIGDVGGNLHLLGAEVDSLQDKATAADKKDNLAADNRTDVERSIKKKRRIALQKYSQVSDWKVSCVVATGNTLDCLGEGYLDGEKAQESYKATVDADGSFIWKLSYGGELSVSIPNRTPRFQEEDERMKITLEDEKLRSKNQS